MRNLMCLTLALTLACRTSAPAQPVSAPVTAAASTPPVAPSAVAAWLNSTAPVPPGVDLGAMDLHANPCDNFYEFACGGWLKTSEIPAERGRWGRGFDVIEERGKDVLRTILEAEAAGKASEKAPYAQKLGALFAGCMDEPQLEKSLPRVKQELAKLSVPTPEALARTLARLHADGVDAAFAFGPTQDFKDASQVIGEVDQGGLSLPDRDYYVSSAPDRQAVLEAFKKHLLATYGLLGQSPAQAKASTDTVLKVETELARAAQDRVTRRDPNKVYHRLDRAGLKAAAPAFPWEVYFKAAGTPAVQALNVTSPAYVKALGGLVTQLTPAEWKTYLGWQYLRAHRLGLPKSFQDEDFAFTSKALSGAKQDLPRWKKCVAFADRAMGFALAVPFVEQTFGADGKAKALEIVHAIESSFEKNLDTLTWMDGPTREKALEKVRNIVNKIGFPEELRRYDSLQADRKNFLKSMDHAAAFETARQLHKIGKPLDRKEWSITPPTVNAYYSSSMNEVVFPAGILQPPFFSREATYPVNFGAMGMVVGHEFTHGFDDEGRQFDAKGNLNNWWSDGSDKAFREKVACVKDQFDQYVAVDDLHLNGALTLGENVADLGGLKLARAAMESWLKAHPEPAGNFRFSPAQQFYLGYAQSWCTKSRPEFDRTRVVTDPHSPPRFRVNGPLSNLDGFRDAFDCPVGSKMMRPEAQHCRVW